MNLEEAFTELRKTNSLYSIRVLELESKLKAQQELIDILNKENKELKQCAEFYAKTERYAFSDVVDGVPVCDLVVDDSEKINNAGAWVGGKKTRETLAKLEAR